MYDVRRIQEQVILAAVENASDGETAREIVYGKAGAAAKADNPTWVKGAMARLEGRFEPSVLLQIRRSCQCGYGMDEKLALVKGLMAEATSMETFGNLEQAKAAGLSCVNGELHLQFDVCPCPMLAEVDRLETDTWCQCTTGYSQVLFEKAFGCAVDVELLQSIKMGAAACRMRIVPREAVWK